MLPFLLNFGRGENQRQNYYRISSDKCAPIRFWLELIRFRLIPVTCPATIAFAENYWNRGLSPDKAHPTTKSIKFLTFGQASLQKCVWARNGTCENKNTRTLTVQTFMCMFVSTVKSPVSCEHSRGSLRPWRVLHTNLNLHAPPARRRAPSLPLGKAASTSSGSSTPCRPLGEWGRWRAGDAASRAAFNSESAAAFSSCASRKDSSAWRSAFRTWPLGLCFTLFCNRRIKLGTRLSGISEIFPELF